MEETFKTATDKRCLWQDGQACVTMCGLDRQSDLTELLNHEGLCKSHRMCNFRE